MKISGRMLSSWFRFRSSDHISTAVLIERAPVALRISLAALSVLPVSMTSSTSITCFPRTIGVDCGETLAKDESHLVKYLIGILRPGM